MSDSTSDRPVRVRFAPSPTGPLHIGGVRTALYNYLFAKKHQGTFILRIEDTDQTRYVEGAEEYIHNSLHWLGLHPDEGPDEGGEYGPYRQSERKDLYAKYAEQLIKNGHAYYAFDSEADLTAMREREEAAGNHTPKYDASTRMSMKNSLTLSEGEVQTLLDAGENITVRLHIPEKSEIVVQDVVRGSVTFNTEELDDKVILKGDGMPTYHLANIVDDHKMQISHVIRGEEWLSSTAHHVFMYQSFGWTAPQFCHLPLLLKPSGKGKLSKRDGAKFGFPVFPMDWTGGEESYDGFDSAGFLPDALLNFLVLLGWNPGDDREILSRDEMVEAFSLERIVKSGAKFDFEKAKWFNQQYIMAVSDEDLLPTVRDLFEDAGQTVDDTYLSGMMGLMKERITTLDQYVSDTKYFFAPPIEYDQKSLKKRFKTENLSHLQAIGNQLEAAAEWSSNSVEQLVKGYLTEHNLGIGAVLPIIRIFMTGGMKGPDLFPVMELLGKDSCLERWRLGLDQIAQLEV